MILLMNSIRRTLFVVAIIFIATLIAGCEQGTPEALPILTETLPDTATSTPELIPSLTVSPQPTIQFAITANPRQVARWQSISLP